MPAQRFAEPSAGNPHMSADEHTAEGLEASEEHSGIELLLRERHKVDEQLRQKYARNVTIMFTDIKGSTAFFETYGDIEGRLMVQHHNDLLFPCIAHHGGRVVKTIGDAIMAAFEEPAAAVRAAAAMQVRLRDYNQTRQTRKDRIRVRMGIHCGRGLVEKQDVFGDVVNVAARIEALAAPDEILITEGVYANLSAVVEIQCRFARRETVRGREEPLDVYRVVWNNDEREKTDTSQSCPPQAVPVRRQLPAVSVRAMAGPLKMLIAGTAGVALIVLLRAGDVRWFNDGDSAQRAYALLHAGQISAAEQIFASLGEGDPRRYEGFAALLYERAEYAAALEMAAQALALAPAMYAMVVRGKALLARGQLDEGLAMFQESLRAAPGAAWQHAEALNGMARIASARGDAARAERYYDKAAGLHPGSAVISANRAWVRQRRGDSAGAIAVLQQAARAHPGDGFTEVLLTDMQARRKSETDAAHRERIDRLVGELAGALQDGVGGSAHEWSYRPAAVGLMPFSSSGAPSVREGEDAFFMLRLSGLLQESTRVQVVERELLSGLLEELRLSASGLVQSGAALQLGRILAARVIATGSIRRADGEIQAHIRLTDTETTQLKGVVSVASRRIEELAALAAERIVTIIQREYPIRGHVLACENERFVLTVGAVAGVLPGMEFNILEERPAPNGERQRYHPAGYVTVASVEQDTACAEAQPGSGACFAGMNIEQRVRHTE
jgi:class 3 adenylate cyclase/tetratricopeptide (TPR) repeat protein